MQSIKFIPAKYRSLRPAGFPVGRKLGLWFTIPDNLEAHVLVTGGTGTGKTSAVLIPLLLNTTLPSFVIDVKGDLTKALKAKGKPFRILDFRGTRWGYDPFSLVRRETVQADIGLVTQCLFPHKGKEDFWTQNARQLLQGLLTHYFLLGFSFDQTLSEILGSNLQYQVGQAMCQGSSEVRTFLGTLDSMNEKTFSGISAELVSSLVNLCQAELRKTFARPKKYCVSPKDLLDRKSILVRLPEDKVELYAPFLQLLVNQFFKFFEQQADGHQPVVNFVLDEFYRLGQMESVKKAAATLRSKGVRVIACCQSFAQLEELYGEHGARVLADNFPYQIILGAHDPNTQRYYSLKAGTTEKKRENFSRNGGQLICSYHWEDVPAVQPEEFGLLKKYKELIVYFPEGWMRLKKRPYYYISIFTRLKRFLSGKPSPK